VKTLIAFDPIRSDSIFFRTKRRKARQILVAKAETITLDEKNSMTKLHVGIRRSRRTAPPAASVLEKNTAVASGKKTVQSVKMKVAKCEVPGSKKRKAAAPKKNSKPKKQKLSESLDVLSSDDDFADCSGGDCQCDSPQLDGGGYDEKNCTYTTCGRCGGDLDPC